MNTIIVPRSLIEQALNWVTLNAWHPADCDVFDLDDEGRHCDCSCGMAPLINDLTTALAAPQKEPPRFEGDDRRHYVCLCPDCVAPREPIAWVHLESWQTGKYWPDDCFSQEECSSQDGWFPLYFQPAPTPPDQEALNAAYEEGWCEAASWANQLHLLADIGSPRYLEDRAKRLRKEPT